MLRSTEEEGLDITTIGKLRYRNGDYHGALIAFNEVSLLMNSGSRDLYHRVSQMLMST